MGGIEIRKIIMKSGKKIVSTENEVFKVQFIAGQKQKHVRTNKKTQPRQF